MAPAVAAPWSWRQPVLLLWRGAAVCGLALRRGWEVGASSAFEAPNYLMPLQGANGPHTYLGDSSLVSCELLDPYPTVAQWDPTVAEAVDICSSLPSCGGFLYTTADAAAAQGGLGLADAEYCRPQSFSSGTASATSGIGFGRYVYEACDLEIKLQTTVSHFHGSLSFSRGTCVRPGRGLSSHRDRPPGPKSRRYRPQPRKTVEVGGVEYTVGSDVFRSEAEAVAGSADGLAHEMQTASGVEYYMPGTSHALSAQPLALDGYFPLYATEAAAQWASTRGGGNGHAQQVGPTTPYGLPAKWTLSPGSQAYYMPLDGPAVYLGDYVVPVAVDGYFPLYEQQADAERMSEDGQAQSHGPGSSTGHPTWWTTGQQVLYYMPQSGPEKYYGNYLPRLDNTPLYETVLVSTARLNTTHDWAAVTY